MSGSYLNGVFHRAHLTMVTWATQLIYLRQMVPRKTLKYNGSKVVY